MAPSSRRSCQNFPRFMHQVRMSYNPPEDWLERGVAKAFGVDPKSNLDEDLARMKTLLETGRPARDAARPMAG